MCSLTQPECRSGFGISFALQCKSKQELRDEKEYRKVGEKSRGELRLDFLRNNCKFEMVKLISILIFEAQINAAKESLCKEK
jgi:hypothetical protein